jgi:hypothetical protein
MFHRDKTFLWSAVNQPHLSSRGQNGDRGRDNASISAAANYSRHTIEDSPQGPDEDIVVWVDGVKVSS